MYIPQLSPGSKRVLQIIKKHGVCKGRQLVSEAELTPEQLIQAIQELMVYELISTTGGAFSVNEISHSYFNVRPSNSSLAELVIKSS
jgi:hypothetical protein